MAQTQLYTLLYVTVNGALLTEESSVNGKRSTNSQPVKTVCKGYAGESPGAPMTELEVTSAIPSADFELDPGPYMANLASVEISVIGPGGKSLTVVGYIVEDSFNHAVDKESGLSFRFRGGAASWQ